MKEAHALEKMTIVEIGPPFRHDDSLLKRAVNTSIQVMVVVMVDGTS